MRPPPDGVDLGQLACGGHPPEWAALLGDLTGSGEGRTSPRQVEPFMSALSPFSLRPEDRHPAHSHCQQPKPPWPLDCC